MAMSKGATNTDLSIVTSNDVALAEQFVTGKDITEAQGLGILKGLDSCEMDDKRGYYKADRNDFWKRFLIRKTPNGNSYSSIIEKRCIKDCNQLLYDANEYALNNADSLR